MSPRAVQAGADPAVLRYAAASKEVSWNGLPGVAPEPVVEHARAEVGGDTVVDAGVVVESIVDHARRLPGVAVDPALVVPGSRASRDHERALRALRMARARRLAFASIAAVTRAP